jgi:phage baseplate assembly protein W
MSIYSDLNQYTPHIKAKLTDVEAIHQSLNNILTTRRYERLFNPEFGLDFEDVLFELIDETTALEIFRLISERVEKFEQRITFDFAKSEVTPDQDNNKYDVLIVYQLAGQPDTGDLEFRGVVSK